MDGHRSKLIDGRALDITSDEYSLGEHFIGHGLGKHTDFNQNCSPSKLKLKRINLSIFLRSLRPLGLIP